MRIVGRGPGVDVTSANGTDRDEAGGRPVGRIAVFRALQLGDMLCATPALRALRAGFPDAEIVLVGLPWAREFARRFSGLVDGFREFPGHPELPERRASHEQLEAFCESMRREAFDLAVQMHGSGAISNGSVARFGAGAVAGFHEAGARPPGPGWFLPYPDHGLEVRRLTALVARLGAPCRGEHLEFPVWEGDRDEARRALASAGWGGGPFACVHAGASVPERRWPIDRFAAAADALAARGLDVVLTGSEGERELTAATARAMRASAIDLAGKTSLGALAALLERARLLVCNDTGVSHVADALETPSVVISTGDNPGRWAPADGRLHRVLCREDGVAVVEVMVQVDDLLGVSSERAPRGLRPIEPYSTTRLGQYAGSPRSS
jgi:ADP-heptose:LPS heptosyltransferase